MLIALGPNEIRGQQQNNFESDIRQLSVMLNLHHVAPRETDDSLSANVFDELIEMCDPMGLVFLKAEYDSLKRYRFMLDDEMKNGSSDFFDSFTTMFQNGVIRSERFLDRSAGMSLNLWVKDTIYFNDGNIPEFALDSTRLQKKWTRYLKYAVLNQLFEKDSASDAVFSMNESELEAISEKELTRIVLREHRSLRHFIDQPMGYAEFMKVVLFNIITTCFDPHTSYFNLELNKWFQAEVSASGYTFGIELETNLSGDIKVGKLLPGGPAWRSGMINKGDVLLSGRWQGAEKADFTMMSLDEIELYFEKCIDKSFVFEIEKADGQVEEVTLHKEKIRQTGDIVHSYVIRGEHTLGYIILPAFYNDIEENKPGCANDVAREILKLKKENIEGVILDLRFNGGGSIQEALDLAGIFIDAGPICMINDRTAKPIVLKDMNRGIAWDGPLMLLVNSSSASASEIIAAAMQDYNRALIVGQTTYGKSTGQIVLPCDTTILPDLSNMDITKKASGFVKITSLKLYRIDGSSHQKTGVTPDLALPDFFHTQIETESSSPYALNNESISKKAYYTPLPVIPVDSLNKLLSARMNESEFYKRLTNLSDTVLSFSDPEFMLFDMNSFKTHWQKIIRNIDELKKMTENFSCTFEVLNHGYDIELSISDEYFRLLNDAAINKIQRDYEIQEAVNIMNDFIGIIKPAK